MYLLQSLGKTMNIDIAAVLFALEIDFEERNGEALGLCPMHKTRTGKEDHSPSWSINLTTGAHFCFSCHYKGNVYQLVADVKGFHVKLWDAIVEPDYDSVKEWLATVAEVPVETLIERVKALPTYVQSSNQIIEMSEARLAVFVDPPTHALAHRKLTANAASMYGVLWDASKSAWILPLRDSEFNKLIGWQEKGTIDRTFMNRPAGLTKSKTLFGIENQRDDVVIVVESPLDCVRFESAGIHGAVAICGSSPSADQIKLLRYSDRIIVAFDNPRVDTAGKKASEEMRKWARKYGMNVAFFNYNNSDVKDPGDMTDEELRFGVDNAKDALLGEQAYV
jgi:5S rRNA maturation endonuclease (ribonuclease M5)